ncbi:hypothetical protein BC829DRAFT_271369 [Chytridium lagenaria]|nr:hypothetical protein BC829DRAFT_271369 [Chytridium lagenaria]
MKKQSGRTGLFDIASSSSSSSSVATGSSRLLNPFLMPPTLPDQTRMSEAAVSTWDSSDLDHGLAYTSHILPKAPDSDDSSDVGVMVSGARKRKRFTAKTTSPDALARPIPRTPPHQISNEAKALHPTPSNWNTSVLVNTPITPLPSPSQQHIANSSSKESKPNAALETILVNTEDAQMRLESPEDSEALSSPTREPSKSNEAVQFRNLLQLTLVTPFLYPKGLLQDQLQLLWAQLLSARSCWSLNLSLLKSLWQRRLIVTANSFRFLALAKAALYGWPFRKFYRKNQVHTDAKGKVQRKKPFKNFLMLWSLSNYH